MKKLFAGIIVTAALATGMALAGCNGDSASTSGGKFAALDSPQSVYAFSAASAGMIISSAGGQTGEEDAPGETPSTPVTDDGAGQDTPPEGGQTETPEGGQKETPGDGQIETPAPQPEGLDAYMELIESLLADGAFDITEQPSDRQGYESKTTFTYRDMSGQVHSYEMHYNAIAERDAGRDRDDDEDEQEYYIDGVMTIDGVDYPVHGERETESERGERESETEFVVELGRGSRIVVEQSFEEERGETEQEYSYSLYRNGRLEEHCSFEYEDEHGETEIEMTMKTADGTNSFFFTGEIVNGREIIVLRIGEGRDARSYLVTRTTDANGESAYEYTPVTRR